MSRAQSNVHKLLPLAQAQKRQHSPSRELRRRAWLIHAPGVGPPSALRFSSWPMASTAWCLSPAERREYCCVEQRNPLRARWFHPFVLPQGRKRVEGEVTCTGTQIPWGLNESQATSTQCCHSVPGRLWAQSRSSIWAGQAWCCLEAGAAPEPAAVSFLKGKEALFKQAEKSWLWKENSRPPALEACVAVSSWGPSHE